MIAVKAFIKSHTVATYFVLTFIISWGGMLLVVGPGGFSGTAWQSDPLFPLAVLAMLGGPAVAGLLLTGFADGRAGLHGVLHRLFRWQVNAGWYAVALLPAPLLAASVLLALSLPSPIFAAGDRAALLLSGLAAGITTILEELGWTGFAVPRLRLRYDVLTTGLIVGILWGAWHLLVNLWVGGGYTEGLPLALFLSLYFFSGVAQLTAYRVLMVWVYDRTESLLVAWLMHASLTASTIFIFTPLATGVAFLAYTWGLAAALWIAVAVVAVASRGQLRGQPLRRRAA